MQRRRALVPRRCRHRQRCAPGIALFAGYGTAFRASFGLSCAGAKAGISFNIEAGINLAIPKRGLSGTIAAFRHTHETSSLPSSPIWASISRARMRGGGRSAVVAETCLLAPRQLCLYRHGRRWRGAGRQDRTRAREQRTYRHALSRSPRPCGALFSRRAHRLRLTQTDVAHP